MRRWLIRFALLSGSMLVALAAGETLMRIVRPDEFSVVKLPAFYVPDEDLGYRYLPGQSGVKQRNSEIRQRVDINQSGFRDVDHLPTKQGDVVRIAVIGDSFVVGMEVPDEQTYPAALQRVLNESGRIGKCEVLNFGIDGTGTEQHATVLEKYAFAFEPDIVVLTYYENDVKDVAFGNVRRDSYRGFVLMYRDTDPAILRTLVDQKLDRPGLLDRACNYSYLARQIKQSGTRTSAVSNVVISREQPRHSMAAARSMVVEQIAEMRRACESAGIEFVVAFMPSQEIVADDEASDAEMYVDVYNRIVESGITCVDLLNTFHASPNDPPLFWKTDSHCTAAGYRTMADGVAEFMIERFQPQTDDGVKDNDNERQSRDDR